MKYLWPHSLNVWSVLCWAVPHWWTRLFAEPNYTKPSWAMLESTELYLIWVFVLALVLLTFSHTWPLGYAVRFWCQGYGLDSLFRGQQRIVERQFEGGRVGGEIRCQRKVW